MSLPVASGVGFAIAGGEPADLGALLHVQPPSRRGYGRRRLFASVEPLEPTARGREVAAAALRALREGFAAASGQSVAVALARAFADANAAVREENRQRPADGPDRRVFVGATAVVLEGRELVVAQVPPSQAAIVQEGQVYAFPALTSWGPRFVPAYERLGPDAEPLGRSDQATVDLFRTLAAPGDLVFLCASAIPVAIARNGFDAANPRAGTPALVEFQEALRHGDPSEAIEHLDEVIERHGLDDAHAACITIGRLHCLDPRIARETAARVGLAWGFSRPVARPTAIRRPRSGRARRSGRRLQASAARRRDYPDPAAMGGVNGGELNGDMAVQNFSTAALRPAPLWLVSRRRQRAAPVAPLLLRQRTVGEIVSEPGLTAAVTSVEQVSEGDAGIALDVAATDMGTPAGGRIPSALPQPDYSRWLPPVPLDEVRHHAASTRARSEAGGAEDRDEAMRLPAREGLVERIHIAAMTLTERVAPPRATAPRKRSELVAPGVLSVHRYRPGFELPLTSDWRCRMPRIAVGHLGRPALLAILVVLFVVSSAGYVRERVLPERESNAIARHLAAADAHVQAAANLTDDRFVTREFAAAAESLELAADAGAGEEVLAEHRALLTLAQDRVRGIVRLEGAERIGGLPEVVDGGYRIVQAGGEIYLIGGVLYRYDREGKRLLRVLAPGDRLGETVVGSLYHASLEAGGLALTDGSAAYTRDVSGTWDVRPLDPPEGHESIWAAAPSAGFNGNLYVLDAGGGQILKFDAGEAGGAPQDWTGGAEQDDLRTARDLVVDGRIHVLLDDGRVLSFYQGALERTYDPPPGTPLLSPVALAPSGDGRSLFLVDGGDDSTSGRVLRLDLETGETREFLAGSGDGVSPFVGICDVVVDETSGLVYLVTSDSLWRLSIPA